MRLVASVCLFVCPSVCPSISALMAEKSWNLIPEFGWKPRRRARRGRGINAQVFSLDMVPTQPRSSSYVYFDEKLSEFGQILVFASFCFCCRGFMVKNLAIVEYSRNAQGNSSVTSYFVASQEKMKCFVW